MQEYKKPSDLGRGGQGGERKEGVFEPQCGGDIDVAMNTHLYENLFACFMDMRMKHMKAIEYQCRSGFKHGSYREWPGVKCLSDMGREGRILDFDLSETPEVAGPFLEKLLRNLPYARVVR